MRQGIDAVRDAIERAKTSGDRTPTNYFGWKAGEVKILRFLSEASDLFVLTLHDWVLCPDGSRRTFVCRRELDASCELCERMEKEGQGTAIRKRESGYGVAVLREEVREDVDGRLKTVGYKDWVEEVEEEVEENGKKTTVKKLRPFVGIVRQAPTNFWLYVDSAYNRNGTIRDRDFEITRRGDDKNTSYVFYPCEPVEIPGIDERYAKYVPDLKSLLEGMGSAEYYAKHLRGEGGGDRSGGNGSGGGSAPQPPAADEETEFERLRRAQASIAAEQGAAPAGTYG